LGPEGVPVATCVPNPAEGPLRARTPRVRPCRRPGTRPPAYKRLGFRPDPQRGVGRLQPRRRQPADSDGAGQRHPIQTNWQRKFPKATTAEAPFLRAEGGQATAPHHEKSDLSKAELVVSVDLHVVPGGLYVLLNTGQEDTKQLCSALARCLSLNYF